MSSIKTIKINETTKKTTKYEEETKQAAVPVTPPSTASSSEYSPEYIYKEFGIKQGDFILSDLDNHINNQWLNESSINELKEQEIRRYNNPLFNDFIQKEIDILSKFYQVYEKDTKYGINEVNYVYWHKNPGTGVYFRNLLKNFSELRKLIQVVNERIQMSLTAQKRYYLELLEKKSKMDLLTSKEKEELKEYPYIQWKFKCHHKRFMYIYLYFSRKYKVSVKNIRNYTDVIYYYKNEFSFIEFDKLTEEYVSKKLKDLKSI